MSVLDLSARGQADRLFFRGAEVAALVGGGERLWTGLPRRLFGMADRGLLLCPADLPSLAQDSAGTTPVTAPGQPVGLLRDLSGNGLHAVQAVSAARPLLGWHPVARGANLVAAPLTTWALGGGATRAEDAALGGYPSVLITDASATGYSNIYGAVGVGAANGGAYVISLRVKKQAGAANNPAMRVGYNPGDGWRNVGVIINAETGAIINPTYWADGLISRGVRDCGDHWHAWAIFAPPAGATFGTAEVFPAHFSGGAGSASAQGSATIADVWMRAGRHGAWYLKFDDIDDFLATPPVPFGSSGRTIVAAFRKRADDTLGVIAESGAIWNASPGGFAIFAPSFVTAGGNIGSRAMPNTEQSILHSPANYPAPYAAVVTATIAAGSHALRINGQVVGTAAPAGPMSALTAPLYIGARNGNQIFAAMDLYALLVIDRVLSAGELALAEAWAADRSGVVLA